MTVMKVIGIGALIMLASLAVVLITMILVSPELVFG